MSNSAITDDNELSLLFKQYQGVSQSQLTSDGQGSSLFNNEKYKTLNGVFGNSVYTEDVPVNLQHTLASMDASASIASSTWNNDVWDQTISATQVLDANGNATPLVFYKDVYLASVQQKNQAWWLPDTSNASVWSTDNNRLRDTIPWKYNDQNTFMFTPIVKYPVGLTAWQSATGTNNPSSLGWVMDYASGFLVFYLSENTLDNTFNLSTSTDYTTERNRPRISFIRYEGTKLSSQGGGGLGTITSGEHDNGTITVTTDVPGIHFDEEQFDVGFATGGEAVVSLNTDYITTKADLSYYLFDKPDSCTDGSGVLNTVTAAIDLSWNLPPQTQAAVPFGQALQYPLIGSSAPGTSPVLKIPFFENIRIQYFDWSNATQAPADLSWIDLSMSGTINRPFIPPTVVRAVVGGPPSTQTPSLEDTNGSNTAPYTLYKNTNVLSPGGSYQFRVFLDNYGIESCVDPAYPANGPVPYNYLYIPDGCGNSIPLGSFGGPTSPTVIEFIGTQSYAAFTLRGYNDDVSGADVSLNVPWSGPGPNQTISANFGLNLSFGFDISGVPDPNPKQIASIRNLYSGPLDASYVSMYDISNTYSLDHSEITTPTSGTMEWYPEYTYTANDFYMISKTSTTTFLAAPAVSTAYGIDSSFSTGIPTRQQAEASISRLLSTSGYELEIAQQGSSTFPSGSRISDAYPANSTNVIENVLFLVATDLFDLDYSSSSDTITWGLNLVPGSQGELVGTDSVGVKIANFENKVTNAYSGSGPYPAMQTAGDINGFLPSTTFSLSGNNGLGGAVQSQLTIADGGSSATTIDIHRKQGYHIDATLDFVKVLNISLSSFPDISNYDYNPYTVEIIDKYYTSSNQTTPTLSLSLRPRGQETSGIDQNGNFYIGTQPTQDTAYSLTSYVNPTTSLPFKFFGLSMPPTTSTPVPITFTYDISQLDEYWRRSLTISSVITKYQDSIETPVSQTSTHPWPSGFPISPTTTQHNPLTNIEPGLAWDSGSSTALGIRYSRNVADTLFSGDQFAIEIEYENNVARPTASFTTTKDVLFGPAGQYLWWDFTWDSSPTGTAPGALPDSFIEMGSALQDTLGNGAVFALRNPVGTLVGQGITAAPTNLNHSQTLANEQLMWADRAFRSPSEPVPKLMPYIDYSSIYYNPGSINQDYSSLTATGASYTFTYTTSAFALWWEGNQTGAVSRTLKFVTFTVKMPPTNTFPSLPGGTSLLGYGYTINVENQSGTAISHVSTPSGSASATEGYWLFHEEFNSSTPSRNAYDGQARTSNSAQRGIALKYGPVANQIDGQRVWATTSSAPSATEVTISIGLDVNSTDNIGGVSLEWVTLYA